MVKSDMANITGIPYSEPHNLSLSLSLSHTHTHTHQISKIGCNMFGDESYFDNFLAHRPAGSGSASISISVQQSVAFSRVSGSASFQTISKDDSISIDWAALSSIQTISSHGDAEINSERVKSDQVQPAISIPGDDETDKCRSLTVRKHRVKRSIKVPAISLKFADIPPDEYSWRKYGQKAIKGSPHPRGYYKCSNMRGCPARKHVERCLEEPLMLIVTYEGEHKHTRLPWYTVALNKSVEIGQRSNADAIENESMSVPLGDIARGTSPAMGNGEMDQGNNIIAVKEPVTNGDYGVDVITRDDIPIEAVEAATEQGFSMAVKATYNGNTAMFRWDKASSGIDELCRKLENRFELEVGSFDIKYKDGDGDWIALSCDEDLRFYVDTLKASRQSTLKLEMSTRGQVEITSENADAIENECTAAISVPLGDIATKIGNDEMDQGNNIIAVTNGDYGVDVITRDDIPIEAVEAAEQQKQGFSMIVKATHMGSTVTFPWGTASSGIDELCRELEKRFGVEVGRFCIKVRDEDGDWSILLYDEDLACYVHTLKASNQSTLKLEMSTLDQIDITSEKITQEISTGRQNEITLEMINQLRGCKTQNEAAEVLGVSLCTLKRRCKELGLERWPYSKRKNGLSLPSSARVLKKNKGQCSNGDVIENEDAATKSVPLNEIARDKSTAMGNDEFDRENDIIAVLATYEDDTVPFPLPCNSGIEELRKELDDSFQIEGGKYKIKYTQEDGRWITLLRDKHLRFHIETLKASGQSTMQLSVFPDSL